MNNVHPIFAGVLDPYSASWRREEIAEDARREQADREADQDVAAKVAQIIRSSFAGLCTELLPLAAGVSSGKSEKLKGQVLFYFGPDGAGAKECLGEILWDLDRTRAKMLSK